MKYPEVIRRPQRFERRDPWRNIPFDEPEPPTAYSRLWQAIVGLCVLWILGFAIWGVFAGNAHAQSTYDSNRAQDRLNDQMRQQQQAYDNQFYQQQQIQVQRQILEEQRRHNQQMEVLPTLPHNGALCRLNAYGRLECRP
jgi:hypothetical protein